MLTKSQGHLVSPLACWVPLRVIRVGCEMSVGNVDLHRERMFLYQSALRSWADKRWRRSPARPKNCFSIWQFPPSVISALGPRPPSVSSTARRDDMRPSALGLLLQLRHDGSAI